MGSRSAELISNYANHTDDPLTALRAALAALEDR